MALILIVFNNVNNFYLSLLLTFFSLSLKFALALFLCHSPHPILDPARTQLEIRVIKIQKRRIYCCFPTDLLLTFGKAVLCSPGHGRNCPLWAIHAIAEKRDVSAMAASVPFSSTPELNLFLLFKLLGQGTGLPGCPVLELLFMKPSC